jgi:hypothetical protein
LSIARRRLAVSSSIWGAATVTPITTTTIIMRELTTITTTLARKEVSTHLLFLGFSTVSTA